MNKLRIILGYLFGFIISVALALLCILLVLKLTVGDKNYTLNLLEKNNYYQKVDNEIKEEMSLYILSSGFTEEIITDVYEYDNLVNDIKKYFDDIYLGKIETVDTSSIQAKITEKINDVFKKSNTTYNNSDLNSFIEGLVNVYSDEVSLYHFTDDVVKYVPKIIKIIDIGIIGISVLIIILLVVLLILKYKYFIASIIASGLIILYIRLFVFERIDVDNLLIITENISEVLRIVLANIMNLLLNGAIVLIGIGIVLTIIKLICQPRKREPENIEIL